MTFLKEHLDNSLVLPLKRELPVKKKKKRKLDSSEGTKEVNHCWDLCLFKQIQARIEHDSEFGRELLESSDLGAMVGAARKGRGLVAGESREAAGRCRPCRAR